ncbi:nectin cell adhesion molecule 1b [Latimeria chalumnae]|uniref:Nectin cell adhesion molecule 1 n=1 Tax=Latimeria chalumnae TaxID=7897 RepID=H3B2S9_LATCH|nr:PREDICTED: nectin-1 isoform X2 [Latimeria chalumnae]|eukprot:XP_014350520.1 PREDICTED: nectin-1 isoform X2 [Latimeria chalumnae]
MCRQVLGRSAAAAAVVLLALLSPVLQAQTVTVDEKVDGFIGDQVVLRCTFSNPDPKIKITQVTWQKANNGSKKNVAIFHPSMGVSVLPAYKDRVEFRKPSLTDATIKMSNLELEDEGAYICEFATFPTGNRENQVNLTVLAKPTNSMDPANNPIIAKSGQTDKIIIATCTSANGKPPGAITWETKLNGETVFREIRNTNGTSTVISQYLLAPSREAHQQQLTCVVNYQSDRTVRSHVLNVLYEPEVTIEGFDGNWYLKRADVKLTCKSDANPPATSFNWRVLNGSIPGNAEVQNNTLFFKGEVTYDLTGTYICEATNSVGTRSGLVEVNITELPNIPPTKDQQQPMESSHNTTIIGAVVGGVLLIAVAAAVVFIVLRRRQRTFKGDYSTKKHVFGNGYSKPGIPPHPPMTQNLQYPEDSDDEKKPAPFNSNYEEDRKMARDFDDDSKRPYFTVEEGETQEEYDDRTLSFQYDPEGPDMADDMISQNDGSVISKKEWYV